MRRGRAGLLVAVAAGCIAAAAAVSGCAAPAEPAPRIDFAGASAVHVVFAEGAGERIEIRGPSYRRVATVALPGSGVRRDESRRTLDRDEVARVISWAGEHDALTLRSPDGASALPTVAAPPPITLEIRIGDAEIGIGWTEGEVWPDAAMGARVAAAVAVLRALAEDFDRASDVGVDRRGPAPVIRSERESAGISDGDWLRPYPAGARPLPRDTPSSRIEDGSEGKWPASAR